MDVVFLAIAIFYLAINMLAFLLMFLDKIKSRKSGAERISEGMLFFMASFLGSIGVYLGMFAFRHKTRKWYFILGIPFLILQNLVLLAFCYQMLSSLN